MKKPHIVYCLLLAGYLIGIHKGNIALWKGQDAEPYRVFPYKASNLPAADQKLLEKGIPIDSDSELAKLLEDYLS